MIIFIITIVIIIVMNNAAVNIHMHIPLCVFMNVRVNFEEWNCCAPLDFPKCL